ncbi:MAG TPA: aryl-sulfate sulfotransferase [Chitinophagales bacterium]|nr:aryl-sulfate sulfotransferase [Chitinophagales bacterium]
MNKIFLLLLCTFSIAARSQTVGLIYNYPGAADGYILFAPGLSDTTYLIDKCGKRIHQWTSSYHPGLAAYLLNDGALLRCGNVNNLNFLGGGQGGLLEKLDWNSNVIWSYLISDNSQCQHHDAIQLPNGNIVAIVWETHTKIDAQNNGRVSVGNLMWSEKIVEIKPEGMDSATIVWQWRAWDHLIQDVDSTKLNYGVIADHPERININLGSLDNTNTDWLHINGLDYNSDLDEIMMSCHNLNEVYIIDHSTTMAEAASASGGNSGHGGDLLYRWGNTQNYDQGTANDQKFYGQHNTTWIPQGLPGAGKILVFNNGVGRPGDDYSTVETLIPPAVVNYSYPLGTDSAYLPTAQDWIYTADPATSLYSFIEGGAQRLYNGNTLICDGASGTFIEIDSLGNNLWEYINPVDYAGILTQGNIPVANTCFRVTFIPSQYPGLAGESLTPGAPIELNPLNYICENYATGVEAIKYNATLTLYPNPFQSSFAIHVPVDVSHATLQVHYVTGRLLYEEKNFSATPQSDAIISLPPYKGVLIVSLKDDSEGGNHLWNMTVIAE